MKMICIHTATTDNAGRYLSAGSAVEVGAGPGEIAPARAKALVDDGSAVDASPPRKAARGAVQPDHTSDEAE